jgi:hypothetical protein
MTELKGRLMGKASVAILGAFVAAGTAFAGDAPISLYGITVGEPLSIQSCGTGRETICWTAVSDSLAKITPPGTTMRQVNFGSASQPRISRYPFFQLMLIDGVVEDITVFTKGVDVQDEALSQLIEKFGKPSDQQVRTVQNRMGARFDYVVASWRAADVTVTYTGFSGTLDNGRISVTSPKALEKIAQASRSRRAVEPKL